MNFFRFSYVMYGTVLNPVFSYFDLAFSLPIQLQMAQDLVSTICLYQAAIDPWVRSDLSVAENC